MKQTVICIVISFFFLTGCATSPGNTPVGTSFQAASSAEFISIHSKDVGWDYIDGTITEVERSDRTSLVELTGFTENSGMEGRFFMSFALRLAQLRGFRYVIYSIPRENGENLESVIIFPQSEDEPIESILGEQYSQYVFYEPRIVMDTESEIWKLLIENCGF